MKWMDHQEVIIERLEQGKSIEDIAKELGGSEKELRNFIHRKRLFILNKDSRNLAYKIVKIKFRHPEYFSPTRMFFEAVGITQKRWWSLYRGELEMTDLEFKNVTLHLGLSLEDAFEAKQLNWIEDLENMEK